MAKKRKIVLNVVIGLMIVGGLISYKIYSSINLSNTSFEEDQVELFIPTGADEKDLEAMISPYLKHPKAFMIIAKQKGYLDRIRPGKYTIKKEMSNNEMINMLRLKSEPINVTFNNLDRLDKLAAKIAEQIEADSLSLIQSFQDKDFLSAQKFNADTALSMYIPNTYQFYWNTSADEFRDRMLNEYKKYWNSSRIAKAKKYGLTPTEVYSLASIVHKESVKADERPTIAGVYLNRLAKRMKLQADPTVIYALRKEADDFDMVIRRVLYKDLKIDSPYNTYKYKGIPPGPIAMPDLSALEAVLNPKKHDYIFFVADVKNYGYHKFESTLRQHNKNKKEYVAWINEQKIKR
jgi:UPF0755 protein